MVQDAYEKLVEVEEADTHERDAAIHLLTQLMGLLKSRDKVCDDVDSVVVVV